LLLHRMKVTEDLRPHHGLNGHDRRKLAAAVRSAGNARQLRRVQATLLLCQKQPLKLICRTTGLSRQSVYNALRRYRRRHRPQDLADRPRGGRPRVAGRIGRRSILAALRLDPRSVGFNATTWTVALLARHLSDYLRVQINPRTLRRRMHEAGLIWKRPRYVYHLRDPHAPQKKGLSSGG
jgi:transposase